MLRDKLSAEEKQKVTLEIELLKIKKLAQESNEDVEVNLPSLLDCTCSH